VVAAFLPDLDANLVYAPAAIVLTDRRLIGFGCKSWSTDEGEASAIGWRSWPLDPLMTVAARENAALGTFDLASADGLIARWRYTQAKAKASRRFVEAFEQAQKGEAIAPVETAPAAAAEGLAEDAPAARVRATSVFFRLLKYSRPHLGAMVLGFSLTL